MTSLSEILFTGGPSKGRPSLSEGKFLTYCERRRTGSASSFTFPRCGAIRERRAPRCSRSPGWRPRKSRRRRGRRRT
jgi:hypothetical protein